MTNWKCSVGFRSSFCFYRARGGERERGEKERNLLPVRERTKCEMQVYMHSRYAAASTRRECNLNSVFYIFVGRVTQPLKFFSMFLLYSVDIL